MCTRFTPLSHTEAQSVLDSLYKTGSAHIRNQDSAGEAADAYPGTTVPLFVLGPDNKLFTQAARWRFESDHLGKLLFNTRIETACQQYHSQRGMWARAIRSGRCLIPARAFFERNASDIAFSEKTGKPTKRLYRISLVGTKAFLMAGIYDEGHFSLITTEPNSIMTPIHNRMPLVLDAGESHIWLSDNFGSLADRSNVQLTAQPAD